MGDVLWVGLVVCLRPGDLSRVADFGRMRRRVEVEKRAVGMAVCVMMAGRERHRLARAGGLRPAEGLEGSAVHRVRQDGEVEINPSARSNNTTSGIARSCLRVY